MKYDLPCDVINDLLPSFVDKLTSDESNKIINEHLENCDNCRAIYSSMKEEIETCKINVKERKLFKMAKKEIATIIVSCVLAFAVIFSGIWYAVQWYTTDDFLTTSDYTLTVNKIDKNDITIKANPVEATEAKNVMYFEGIESDYPLRDDLVDLINEQGYIYQLIISSDKYTIDEVAGNVLDENNSTLIEVWSHHKNKFKKHQRHSYEMIYFDDITAVYGFTESIDEKEIIWTADMDK